MRITPRVIAGISLVLVLFLLISAGCTTIPGPEQRTVQTPVKTTIPVTPQVKTTPVKTITTTPLTAPPTPPPSPLPTPVIPAAGSGQDGSVSQTCAQQNGGIAQPGETCPGAWLVASDTFSCCSQKPVREASRNTSITVEPFTLVIDMDDTFPTIQQ
jgi:hypothetical protein